MNQTSGHRPGVRVANFSKMTLPGAHRLNFDSQDVATIVGALRRYTDLPYVFVAEKENSNTIAELLSALRAIRSTCYPYAVFLTDGADLDLGDPDLDIVPVGGDDAQAVRESIDRYAAARFSFDPDQLRLRNSSPLPSQVDVAIVGAGITGLYASNRSVSYTHLTLPTN